MSMQHPASARPVVAIVGATGAVGVDLIQCLAQRKFPLSDLKLLASARSAGRFMEFQGRQIPVEELTENSFEGVDIALFSAGSTISRRFAPAAVASAAVVIDNSSAFRLDAGVPLVVPEINPQAAFDHAGIIANPNCSTIISITPLWPIHRINPIRRLVVSTYQAASGAGAAAMDELRESTRAYLDNRLFEPRVLPHPYAFNAFSHNSDVDPQSGYNEEEIKIMRETRKIFGDETMRISATCVRIPVLRAHCISVHFECEAPISADEVSGILQGAAGVKVVDDRQRNYFPMPRDATGQDDLLVGRIRQDASDPTGRSVAMFVAGDQLLKGAALNAVQIAELLQAKSQVAAMA